MTEEEWLACPLIWEVLGHLGGALTKRKMRLLACACCRRLGNHLSQPALDILTLAERYADREVKKGELPTGRAGYGVEEWVGSAVHLAAYKHANNYSLYRAMHGVLYFVGRTAGPVDAEHAAQRGLLRDIFGNPFRPVALDPAWLTSDVLALARGIYDERAFDRMPILADALQDAGCDNPDMLNHCRDANQVHVRGCWVVDLVLGKI